MGSTVNGKHLNVELDFNANTSKAKREIQELQKQLSDVIKVSTQSTGTGNSNLDKKIRDAASAALELKKHLSDATNVNTGKLDLSSFQKSLKTAGRDLSYFRKTIAESGPEGKKAFSDLTDSIMRAEVPLRKTSALLHEFGVTLKNTARWQISSSILHGFMGSVQTAYHYAEDLNRSLNNIRIVTGQNTDQMASFAKQANEAAKALSTTTTKYTDAALIYYQQGLSDKEVKERTDVTVKMANVARESAEEVSNQMTAVWNNFNKDGTQAAESFADKMTALGAATASSTSEIAEGLSKFAGIADTIGLSFDYATSALATVTATSRESADVVGTAFKTIFARMEGLKQGEVLEDGTELNKYSEGLAKIGVQIKEQDGSLKSMDTILEDMGKKWQGLSEDQKVATAQTVAGVRQYNQLITLMDNWDFFQKNLATAQGSEGTLQKQADIYAESWEAARDRVTAAAEEIYSQLINDDFFIDLNDFFAGFLGVISDAIDGLGGLKGVLLGIGSLVTKIFGKEIAVSLSNIFTTNKKRMEAWKSMQDKALDEKAALAGKETLTNTAYEGLKSTNDKFIDKVRSKSLTQEQQEVIKGELEIQKDRLKNLELLEEEVKQAKLLADKQKERVAEQDKEVDKKIQNRNDTAIKVATFTENFDEVKFKEAEMAYEAFVKDQKNMTDGLRENSAEFKQLTESLGGNIEAAREYAQVIEEERAALEKYDNEKERQLFLENEADDKQIIAKGAAKQVGTAQKEIDEKIEDPDKINVPTKTFSDKAVAMTQAITGFGMALSTTTSLLDTWKEALNGSGSVGDALISTFTSLGMVVPTVVSGINALRTAFGSLSTAMPILAAITGGIIAVTAVVKTLIGWWNADANAAKEAAKSAQIAAEAYDQVRNSYEELKALLEDYSDAEDALSHLTAGTKEWKDAVYELNQQVLELIDKYPQLAKYVTNKNGKLTLNSAGQAAVEEETGKKADAALVNKLTTQINAIDKRNQSTYTNFSRSDANHYEEGEHTYSAESEDVKKIVELLAEDSTISKEETQKISELTGVEEGNVKAVLSNADKINEVISEVKANTEASNLYKDQISETLKNDVLKNESDESADILTGLILNKAQAIQNGDYNVESGLRTAEVLSMGEEELKEEYKRLSETTQELEDIDEDTAKDWLIWDAAIKDSTASLSEFKEITKKVNSAGGTGAEKLLSGNTNAEDYNLKEFNQLQNVKYEDLNLTEEDAQKLGIDEKFWDDNLKKLGENYEAAAENLANSMSESTKKIFYGLSNVQTLGYDAQEAIAEVLGQAMQAESEETVDTFKDLYQEAFQNDKLEEFGEALENINWEDPELDEFKQALADAGVQTKYTDEQLGNFIEQMKPLETDTSKLTEQFAKVNEITKDMKLGDIISPDDYNALLDVSDQVADFFETLSDGTHKLKADGEDFQKFIKDTMLDKSLVNVKQAESQNKNIEIFQENQKNGEQYSFDELSNPAFTTGAPGEEIKKSNDFIETQLQLIKAVGDQSKDTQAKVGEWLETIEKGGSLSTDSLKEISEMVSNCKDGYDLMNQTLKENEEIIQGVYYANAFAAESMQELDDLLDKGYTNATAYNEALVQLHTEQRNSSVDLEETKKYGKYLQDLAKTEKKAKVGSQELSKELENHSKRAKSLATQIQRMNQGVETLSGNWKTWSKILKKGSEGADEHRKAVEGTRKAIANLADVSEDYVSLDFVESLADNTENMKLMEKAAKGDGETIDELKAKLSTDIISNILVNNKLEKGSEEYNKIMSTHEELKKLLSKDLTLEIGARIKGDFQKKAREFIKASKMTVDEANSYFRSLGVEPHFKTVYKEVTSKKPIIKTTTKVVPRRVHIEGKADTSSTAGTGENYETVIDKYETSSIVGYKDVKEKVAVPAISSDGSEPDVTFTSLGNGSVNDSSSSNPGGGSSGNGGGGGGGSHGGGRGKSMPKMKKVKANRDKMDPYWDENQAINQTERKINKLNEQSNYKFGKEKIKLLNKQNELLNKQLENYKKLGEEQKKQLQKMKDNAADKVVKNKKRPNRIDFKKSGLGLKVKYDKDGYISNYEDVMKQSNDRLLNKKNKVNEFQEDYKTFRKDYEKKIKKKDLTKEEKKDLEKMRKHYLKRKKILEKAFQDEQKLYDQRMDFIQQHTETEDEIQERLEQERQAKREMIENNAEKWEAEIQLKIDTRQAERDWNKFIKKMNKAVKTITSHSNMDQAKENIIGNRDTLKDLTKDYADKTKEMQTYEWISNNWEEYTKLVPETERLVSSASEAKEKANEYKKELEEIGENAMAELQEGWNTYLDSINDGIEAIDFMNDKLQQQGDILDYGKQMLEMVYGGKAYDKMEEYYKTQDKFLTTQQATLENQQKKYTQLFEESKALKKANDSAFDEDDVRTWSEDMVYYYNAAQNAAGQLRDTNLKYVQNQIDMYDNLVDKEMDAFERSLTGGDLLDEEIERWERAKKEADLYLDDTERTYEIQTLLNKYDKSINDTKDVKVAENLKKLRDAELKQLSEKKKLTEFDLKTANARYELELKRIALEEAQKNKNTMKLSRNAEGNWSYQYVANQDDIQSKQQELLDAENNWYEMSKENQRRTKDALYSTWQEVIPKIKDILKDQSLSVEDRIKKAEELAEWAKNMSGGLADENYVSIQNMLASTAALLTTAYETDSKSFEQYNKDKVGFLDTLKNEGIKDFHDLFDQFGLYAEDGAKRLVNALVGGEEGGIAALPSIVKDSYEFLTGEDNSLLKAFNIAGDDIIAKFAGENNSVQVNLSSAFNKIQTAGQTCWSNISVYITGPNGVLDQFKNVYDTLDTIKGQMDKVTERVVTDLRGIRDYIYNELIPAYEKLLEKVNQSADETLTVTEAPVPETIQPEYTDEQKAAAAQAVGAMLGGGIYAMSNGSINPFAIGNSINAATKGTSETKKDNTKKNNGLKNGTTVVDGDTGKIIKNKKKKKKKSFDTGGYTGSWDGNDGRLAILHQKELVLNQEDTKNILNAVDGIRDISSLNGSISDAIASSISNLFANSVKNAFSQTVNSNMQKQGETYTIENITAEFPNAQNVDEIREAIMSLPRLASQYVARNLK